MDDNLDNKQHSEFHLAPKVTPKGISSHPSINHITIVSHKYVKCSSPVPKVGKDIRQCGICEHGMYFRPSVLNSCHQTHVSSAHFKRKPH